MTAVIDLRVIELLAARLCHDLIGPISAIGNGVELLTDEEPEFVKDAVALIADSAAKASRHLQFNRFALGHSGGALTGAAPHQLAAEFFADAGVACEYRAELRDRPLAEQKLACAMLAVARDGVLRGGLIVAGAGAVGPEVEASGTGAGVSAELRAALALAVPTAELTARTVGGYVAGLLAAALGWRIVVSERPDGFGLTTAK